MRLALIFFSIFTIFSSQAETLRLVTGEYAPYTAEKSFNGGVSVQVVKAVFAELNQDIKIEFMPWKRAMNNLLSSQAAGSFPWAINDERAKDLYYSKAMHSHLQYRYVQKTKLVKNFEPEGKKLCQPSGWDNLYFKSQRKKLRDKILVEQPISLESCMQMLAIGRVDFVVMNQYVADEVLHKLYPKDSPIIGVPLEKEIKTELYFVVPKKYPNAEKILADFNRGLTIIKNNGKYDAIFKNLAKEMTKSSCVTCNQLGSL